MNYGLVMNRCCCFFCIITFVYVIEQASKHRLPNKVQMCTIYEHYDANRVD